MTIRFDRPCISSQAPARLAALASLALALSGCVLTGIEPDEIDVADDETGLTGDGSEGDGDGDGDAGGDGDATTTGDGDGDGDPGTGDGDGDTGSGDGDGDGDPSTTGDGDGDGDGILCGDLLADPVYDGSNLIVLTGNSGGFDGSCGGPGPDALFVYEAIADGLVTFDLVESIDFDAKVYLVGPSCLPLDEIVCSDTGVEAQLTVGQLVYIVVDSAVANKPGEVILTIKGP